MSEIIMAAAANWMKQSMELTIEKGVPREAAFVPLEHLRLSAATRAIRIRRA